MSHRVRPGALAQFVNERRAKNPANALTPVFFADPGCVSSSGDIEEWLQANLGGFAGFATLQDLQSLNSNFSSVSGDCRCSIAFPN